MFEALSGRTPGYLDGKLYKRYAVIAPFLPDTQEFLFEVRAATLSRQPGEICFPGGRLETGETPLEAALRETEEELLVSRSAIRVVAPLDIYTAPYHMVVHPFLGELRGYEGSFGPDEVAQVFTVPFDFFLNTEPQVYYNEVAVTPKTDDFPYHLLGQEPYPWRKSVYPLYFYEYGDRVIWGMTARIVRNIVELYRAEP